MNIRVIWNGESVSLRGKTDRAMLPPDLIEKLVGKFPSEKFKGEFGITPVCLYGEGFGAGIQKGGKYLSDKDFVLFDVMIYNRFLPYVDAIGVAATLGTPMAPLVNINSLEDAIKTIQHKNLSSAWGDFLMEGLVLKPAEELYNQYGERVITKIKHKDYFNEKTGEPK
jgi:hypothetical protein